MTPGSPPDPEGRGDPRLGRLLRWYPRAWRDRYGKEFLAMVEDTLDGGRPGWRLRLGVIRAGLRERSPRPFGRNSAGLIAAECSAVPKFRAVMRACTPPGAAPWNRYDAY
jgi:hypothetical protein